MKAEIYNVPLMNDACIINVSEAYIDFWLYNRSPHVREVSVLTAQMFFLTSRFRHVMQLLKY
jgi:hypothetical protein